MNYNTLLSFKFIMKILSFDIGTRNLGISIQTVDGNKLNSINNIEKKFRYSTIDGSPSESFKNVLDEIYLSNELNHVEVFDLTKTKNKKLDNDIYLDLIAWLKSQKELFEDIDLILIECQMTKNFKACCLQHCINMWFLIEYGKSKETIVFPSKFKTHILGANKKIEIDGQLQKTNKTYRKNFAKERVKYILEKRNDAVNQKLIYVDNKKKQDDICDAIIQCQAFLFLRFVEKIF